MIDLIAGILSIALPTAASVILISLAYWIYHQKVSSLPARFTKLNLAIFVFLLGFCGIIEIIHHILGAIQADIYEVWTIKCFYFLTPISATFLLNAISMSVGYPFVSGFKDRFKKEPWIAGVILSLQAFALVTALLTFLPKVVLAEKLAFWYVSVYTVFFVTTSIVLVQFLRKAVSIAANRKAAYTVWGGALTLMGIQFLYCVRVRMFTESFGTTSTILAASFYLITVILGRVMIYVGFTGKTAFERFVLPVPIAEHALNIREGEAVILTYSSASDKMKVFSAFIREGLESGDAVWYSYPDEESETVRAKLKEHGIDVEKYEKNGALYLESELEGFMSNGKMDYNKAVVDGLNWWAESKRKGYKHVRDIEDVGDFSFVNGQWQKYIKEYWLDPRWEDPDVSEWVKSGEPVGVVYDPILMEITAINVEHMTETEVNELLKAFGEGNRTPARFIDLLKDTTLFSKSIGLNHEGLTGRKILLEFDSISDYEKAVHNLAKETAANVEPIFVFTSKTSSVHACLTEQPAVKFFLTSISTSAPTSTSENTVLLPANNMSLILDATNKILENSGDANVCFVFDILSELLTSVGREKTHLFLQHALELLTSKKTTALFLFNPSAHEPQVVSSLKNLFSNQLFYGKNGLKTGKIS